MAEDKKTASDKLTTDRIPVANVTFTEAQDLPGEQKMGVTCAAEHTKERRSYVAWYVPLLNSIEIHTANNANVVGVDLIPLAQVRRWKKL
jgi:hypothetical protein